MGPTLARYIVRRTALLTGAWAFVILALYLGVDLADRTAAGGWALSAWPLRWPTALSQTLPFAALAGATHTLVALVRSGEWTAARASGVRVPALLRSVLVVAALVAVAQGVLVEWVAPAAAVRWGHVGRGPLPGASEAPPAPRWAIRGDRIVRSGDDPLVVTLGPSPTLEDGRKVLRTPPAPPAPGTLSSPELLAVARSVEATGHDPSAHRAELAFRPVVMASAWFLPWIALPLALGRLRRSALAAAASAGAVAVVSYLVLVIALHAARAGVSSVGCALSVVGLLGVSGLMLRLR